MPFHVRSDSLLCFLFIYNKQLPVFNYNIVGKKLKNIFITGHLPKVCHRLGKPESLWNQKEILTGNLIFL